MKPRDRATIAEIAARHAAEVAPDVRAVVVPRGVSGLPYAVWREAGDGLREGLYEANGAKSYRDRMWAHMPKRVKRPPSPHKGVSKERAEKLRLHHAAGRTIQEIADITGTTYASVSQGLFLLGLKSNRKGKANGNV